MAFIFSSFLGGAAKTALETIEQEEKDARTNAAIQTKMLYENYLQNKKDNVKYRQELVSNLSKLNDAIPPTAFATPQERENALYEMAVRPGTMSKLNQVIDDKAFDPTKIVWKDVVKLQSDPSDKEALRRILESTTFPTTLPEGLTSSVSPVKAGTAEQAAKAAVKGGGIFGVFGERETERAIKEASISIGLTPQELSAGARYTKPSLEGKATINLGVFTPKDKFNDIENNVQVALKDAMDGGDPVKIEKAVKEAAKIVAVKSALVIGPKETEADVIKNLTDKAIAARAKGDRKEEARLTTEIRLRQELTKVPKEEKEDKITMANKIAIAKGAVNGAVSALMPAGSLSINQNGDLVPTNIQQDAVHKKAVAAGQQVAIGLFAPKGVVTDPQDIAALASIGISVDPTTKKPVVPTTVAPTPVPAPSSAPALSPASAPVVKTVTKAQVEEIAKRNSITYEVAKRQAISEGYQVVEK